MYLRVWRYIMVKRTHGLGGFTLAEVLITLGIIGVVAAMTMPTLINSTQGAQYKTAYKKALSVMSQAVVMNIALEDYDLSQTVTGGTNDKAHADEGQTLYTLFKNRMNVVKVADGTDFSADAEQGDADYYKIASAGDTEDRPDSSHFKTAEGGGNNVKWVTQGNTFGALTYMFFNDGITFIFDNAQNACAASTSTVTTDAYCFGWIDVNGQKGPNRVVQCDTDTLDGAGTDDATCTVSNTTDIYPVMFYDQTIAPASAAGRAVLYAK